jgi:hypothetical protein
MIKAVKEIITIPAAEIRIASSVMKGENIWEKPVVSLSSTIDDMPNPIFCAKRSRKSVEATHSAKLMITRLVCIFLRSRSLIEKEVSLIFTNQPAVFQTEFLLG